MISPEISAAEIIKNYDVIFLDAYGVLVDTEGALEHACEFIQTLNSEGKRYCVLSNSSYISAHQSWMFYRQKGLDIQEGCVITAAGILSDYLTNHAEHQRIKLLGGSLSKGYLRTCGAKICEGSDYAAVVIGDQEGLQFPCDINALITEITHKILDGEDVVILLANPDRVYPISAASYGITSGSLASILQEALSVTLAHKAPPLIAFGKPYSPIFQKAHDFALNHHHGHKPHKMVMIGDQIATDIKGGNEHGMSTVLMKTGVSCVFDAPSSSDPSLTPTYICDSLLL
ncbi:MAG: HAD hydrolase-like protein [Proteobacteria bacterium]|nr:HAD hydrolase-like protein [Pseudomonadota bacterium]